MNEQVAFQPPKHRRSIVQDAFNLPNLLTMGRVLAIPPFLYFLDKDTPADGVYAALIFTAAALTDLLDGYLARKLNLVSIFGKLMDPLTDKLIVMASLVWCAAMGRITPWIVVVLLGRELTVNALRMVAVNEGVVIAAGQEGKTKTALQMIGIIALVLGYPYELSYYPGIHLGAVDLIYVGTVLLYISLFFSLASAGQYLRLLTTTIEAKVQKKQDDTLSPQRNPS
ncbi:CDP-diacylglycerol--glycerol-3-phosphate 3-phosphatidyltransferase [Pajaroellobacter abortibovis]|uniref:CDP-diacylglycerol--glycerol-3-phosphate 3-phosphatidyltransferase n=1 Tax=Pajaroellobacter abortibovis TaxID=1882918 RepID=A0A1L6MW59_9BACT|nr:CDP-diacylglycerol--glycerol-3-phosphate 3-phosphatidyltransferase [Pajaroellobacter abortibovis]APR99756.1 CDP-diacylglycerol--glycerol-3-phosphate 3-phosphatidyltransferase [Pajaroellobacter abortibovis]